MTGTKKATKRISSGLVHEAGKHREVIVVVGPGNIVGFRAKGCKKQYDLTAEACFNMAVKAEARLKAKEKRKAKKKKK